jgi:hypothetical protein
MSCDSRNLLAARPLALGAARVKHLHVATRPVHGGESHDLLERLPAADGYRIKILPAFENFRSENSIADARRIHELVEAHVRRVPEQFLWVHRRFKGLDASYPDYYA